MGKDKNKKAQRHEAGKDTEIANLKAQMAEMGATIGRLQTESAIADTKIGELEVKLTKADATIKELKSKLMAGSKLPEIMRALESPPTPLVVANVPEAMPVMSGPAEEKHPDVPFMGAGSVRFP